MFWIEIFSYHPPLNYFQYSYNISLVPVLNSVSVNDPLSLLVWRNASSCYPLLNYSLSISSVILVWVKGGFNLYV